MRDNGRVKYSRGRRARQFKLTSTCPVSSSHSPARRNATTVGWHSEIFLKHKSAECVSTRMQLASSKVTQNMMGLSTTS
jgi:hypothetical protein